MSTSHTEFEDLCAAFAIGALDGPERERLRAHLPTCAACRQRVTEFEESATWLALGLAPIQPSDGVKRAVMQRISGQHGTPSGQAGGSGPGLLMAVALGLAALALASAAGMGVLYFKTSMDLEQRTNERDALDAEADRLKARVTDLEKVLAQLSITKEQLARKTADLARRDEQYASLSRDLEGLKKKLERLEKIERLLQDVDTRVVDLAGTGPAAGGAKGRVLWRGEDVVFIAEAMPALNGKTYELWAIDPARGAQKAGLFSDLGPGGNVLDVRELGFDPGNVAKFAISVEPAGGSPDRDGPTGDIILINP